MTLEPDPASVRDPLSTDTRVADHLGAAWGALVDFHRLLTEHGVERGLIGPREPARLWERHLLNSAAVVPKLTGTSSVLDLGSGAGLPGIVVAAMMPDVTVTLLEPMERRCAWLNEVVDELKFSNARVLRARAEEVVGSLAVEAVTARAVGNLDRLYRWAGPLLVSGGRLVALKGSRAMDEVSQSARVGARAGFGASSVSEVSTVPGIASTWVVVAYKDGVARGTR